LPVLSRSLIRDATSARR